MFIFRPAFAWTLFARGTGEEASLLAGVLTAVDRAVSFAPGGEATRMRYSGTTFCTGARLDVDDAKIRPER